MTEDTDASDLFDGPAQLTVWPRARAASIAECQEFRTLGNAITAAAKLLRTRDVRAWIITDRGDILAPAWLEKNLDRLVSSQSGESTGLAANICFVALEGLDT